MLRRVGWSWGAPPRACCWPGRALPQSQLASSDGGIINREYPLKALFLYNFGGYVEWPDESFASDQPFVIGILGKAPLDQTLREIAARPRRSPAGGSSSSSSHRSTAFGPATSCSSPATFTRSTAQQVFSQLQSQPVIDRGRVARICVAGRLREFLHRSQQDPVRNQHGSGPAAAPADQCQAAGAGQDRPVAHESVQVNSMKSFKDFAINTKLTLLVLFAGGVALLMSCIAFVTNDVRMIRSSMVKQMSAADRSSGLQHHCGAELSTKRTPRPSCCCRCNSSRRSSWPVCTTPTEDLCQLIAAARAPPTPLPPPRSPGYQFTDEGYLDVSKIDRVQRTRRSAPFTCAPA